MFISLSIKVTIFFMYFRTPRGCSYGGVLAQLGGLANLRETSPSLRNSSYTNIMCSYDK